MEFTPLMDRQRQFFRSGVTLDLSRRKQALRDLLREIEAREDELLTALQTDLGKAPFEGYMTELGMVREEIRFHLKHLGHWARDKRVPTPLSQFPARSIRHPEPYGVVLIMAPWNYPIQLSLEPLIGAISAGNCAVLKPSAYAPACSHTLKELISACLPDNWVTVVEGGRAENQALLDQKFDYIFFTGGVAVGREVMSKAARHLTPVTLELGGKSPCVVDATAKLDLAAKRLVFGKLLNCGQTCVAPDYLLIDGRVKDQFLSHVKKWMTAMYGQDPLDNQGYVRMINRKHYDRVMGLIDPAKVVYGGQGDPDTLKIQPTILDGVSPEDPVMQEEIFGPLLPVLTYDTLDRAVEFINSRPHPLALYLFSEDRAAQERFLRQVPFGGGCVNDTIIHLATSRMGFGGVGDSGMGSYHGKLSFDTFSHRKSVVKKSTWMDLPVRYAPYTALQEKLLRLFLR